MKNIYRIGGGDLNAEEFELDVVYDNAGLGFNRFLPPPSNLSNRPLINIFNLDKLNKTGDPQPDGKFDFITGITINPPLGIIMFPVLEPFGNTLQMAIDSAGGMDTLYCTKLMTVARTAREFTEFTGCLERQAKTVLRRYSLGINSLRSVRVTSVTMLKENADFRLYYWTGKILIKPSFNEYSDQVTLK